jgi:hypothetical protein
MGFADPFVAGLASATDSIAGSKSGFYGEFRASRRAGESLELQQFPATPLRRALAFATITR